MTGGGGNIGERGIDFINYGNYSEPKIPGQSQVGDSLGLNTFGGIDQKDGTITGLQSPFDFVIKIHMAGSVDEIQSKPFVVHGNGSELDGDPPFPFDGIAVEKLRSHLVFLNSTGDFQHTIR